MCYKDFSACAYHGQARCNDEAVLAGVPTMVRRAIYRSSREVQQVGQQVSFPESRSGPHMKPHFEDFA